MKKISLFLLTVLSFFMLSNGGITQESDRAMNEEFLEIFDYEIQNRAFALNSFEAILADDAENPHRAFYEAYHAMEIINQKKYGPFAKKYNLDMAPRWWARTRTSLGLTVGKLFQGSLMKVMHNATIKYVGKLERLEQLAPEEDKLFFTYVVAQEQTQADAIGFLIDGDLDKAVARINDFLISQQTE
ncbi:MAG: hypothetical protein P8H03_00885 [Emcibacteraceae bacterium]|nr:hypothetical protein [Emcibacteraceae bacterium]MDG1857461.1 hypothetical protein [Emcibacteraceae bacterium]